MAKKSCENCKHLLGECCLFKNRVTICSLVAEVCEHYEEKKTITSFALYQVTNRLFTTDFDIMNNSDDGWGVYKIIFKKPISDVLMSVFMDTLKEEFDFQKGRDKVIISCEVELFKGLLGGKK